MAKIGLVDQYENPISSADFKLLETEVAVVGAIHARPPFQGHIAFGLNPERLGAIVNAADSGSSMAWFQLAEEMEEICPHYATVLNKRKRQIIALPITVEAADASAPEALKDAELIERWLKTQTLQQGMLDIVDAIGKGFSVNEMIWRQMPPDGGTSGYSWPCEFIYDPQRFFEFSYIDGKTPWLRTENGFEDLQPHKFLVHRHPSKSGNITRSSLARQVAFLLCFALFNQKDWALFVQGYGLPIRVGKYGPGASPEDKAVLRRAVFSIAGDVAAIIPDSMVIDFVSAPDKAAGASLYEKRGDWLNHEISKLVLGSTAGTDAINGSHAVGNAHRSVEDDVEKFDASLLGFSLNRQVVPTIVAFTSGPRPGYPTLSIGRPHETPLAELIDAVADWAPLGMKFKASELYERLQLTQPKDGDVVIGGLPQPGEPSVAVIKPPLEGLSRRTFLGPLSIGTLARETPPDLVDQLTTRLSEEAAGALHGLTDQVKAAFMAATSMKNLKDRLHKLKLDPGEYATVMSRGMAVAYLVGQAEMLQERGRRHDIKELPDLV
jgi:phage gp29-like protein